MIDHGHLERLRSFDSDGQPVVTVYLGVDPGRGELRSVTPRLKDLLASVRVEAASLDRDAEKAVRADADRILGMARRIGDQQGHGVAVFSSSAHGLLDLVALPAGVRDRAVLDIRPYLAPVEAMLEELRRACTVVLDRRRAEIHRFDGGELEAWEQLDAEELRKSNYGGFAGYEERRVRTHADEVAHRHYRDTAARLAELLRDDGFDLLVVGGQAENVDGLVAELSPELAARLAGTFAVDTHTVTPAIVAEHCRQVMDGYEAREHAELADRVLEVAKGGGLAAVGLAPVLAAVNQRAVDLLVVAADDSVEGTECPSCGWLADESTAACPACGEAPRRVPDLVDAMASAVRSAGGSARHLLSDTPLDGDRVGALLRFPVPALE